MIVYMKNFYKLNKINKKKNKSLYLLLNKIKLYKFFTFI